MRAVAGPGHGPGYDGDAAPQGSGEDAHVHHAYLRNPEYRGHRRLVHASPASRIAQVRIVLWLPDFFIAQPASGLRDLKLAVGFHCILHGCALSQEGVKVWYASNK
jgi:hypothetical protein